MAAHDKKMGAFLREVSNWTWEEFFKAEHDDSYTSNEAIIFSLIRSCAMQRMEAIRMSLHRLDGKLKTPVNIEFPKIYYLFPNAIGTEGSKQFSEPIKGGYVGELVGVGVMEERNALTGELIPVKEPELEVEAAELPSLSLRDTLDKMSDYPLALPKAIIERAQEIENAVNAKATIPPDTENPKVKSVVAAHLLTMAASRNLAALTEVFDQIDGKLAETVKLGEDMFIVNFSTTAPEGAVPNADGILQVEAEATQSLWAQKLGALL